MALRGTVETIRKPSPLHKKRRLREDKRYDPGRIRLELAGFQRDPELEPTFGCAQVLLDSDVPEMMGEVRDYLLEEWEKYVYHYTWVHRVSLLRPTILDVRLFLALGKPVDKPAVALHVVSDSYVTPPAKEEIPKFKIGSSEDELLCSVYVEKREEEFVASGRVFNYELEEIPVENGWEDELQTAVAEKLAFIFS